MARLSNQEARELLQGSTAKGTRFNVSPDKFKALGNGTSLVVNRAKEQEKVVKRGVSPAPGKKSATQPKRGKFGNIKVPDPEGGPDYDSRLEAKHGAEYVAMKKAGLILDVERQVPFKLHAGIIYKCDFLITHLDGSREAVDSKGMETDAFKLKKKLLLFDYPDLKFTIRKAKTAKNKARKTTKRGK